MPLDLLAPRTDSAAANMATDFLLLQHYPAPTHARFRAYGWSRPAVTFGFGQKIAWVRDHLPADFDGELCRRPTGGGIVDHRNDYTYALVIPRESPVADLRAVESYRLVHEALAAALRELGHDALVKLACEPPSPNDADENPAACAATKGPTVCFTRAELYDVVHPATGVKLAGAAQKRSKRGLLFQGSLHRTALARDLDDEAFHDAFTSRLATTLNLPATPAPWPDLDESITALAEQYGTSEWIDYR